MNKVTWFEIPTDDKERAEAFYKKVFGWQFSSMTKTESMAVTVKTDERGYPLEIGAINGNFGSRTKALSHPTIDITVDDIDATLKAVVESGGEIVEERSELPEMKGAQAKVKDSEGNIIGLWQNL